jgi:hypothetical protein
MAYNPILFYTHFYAPQGHEAAKSDSTITFQKVSSQALVRKMITLFEGK